MNVAMGKFASLFAIVVLVVFTASISVHAATANAMALDMAMADGSPMSMTDCQSCPENGDNDADGAACNMVCTGPTIAMMTSTATTAGDVSAFRHDRPTRITVPHWRRAPPDPFPPRTLM